jgi:UDP-N-acetyl-D-galactosamine dehydrogenase
VVSAPLGDVHGAVVAVIGLGYVGLPLAVEFGRVREVIGYDIDSARVKELKRRPRPHPRGPRA